MHDTSQNSHYNIAWNWIRLLPTRPPHLSPRRYPAQTMIYCCGWSSWWRPSLMILWQCARLTHYDKDRLKQWASRDIWTHWDALVFVCWLDKQFISQCHFPSPMHLLTNSHCSYLHKASCPPTRFVVMPTLKWHHAKYMTKLSHTWLKPYRLVEWSQIDLCDLSHCMACRKMKFTEQLENKNYRKRARERERRRGRLVIFISFWHFLITFQLWYSVNKVNYKIEEYKSGPTDRPKGFKGLLEVHI